MAVSTTGVIGVTPGLVPGSGVPVKGGAVINVLVILSTGAVSEGAVSGGAQLELS